MPARIIKRAVCVLAVGCAAALAPAVASAAHRPQRATYAASGTYMPSPEGGSYNYSGSLSCTSNCPAGAQSGTFFIDLVKEKAWPPEPTIAQKASGDFSIQWTDGTSTSGSLTAHNIDHQGYSLDGLITGGTNLFLPPNRIKGFVTYPPVPVSPGPFTGTLQLRLPPTPI